MRDNEKKEKNRDVRGRGVSIRDDYRGVARRGKGPSLVNSEVRREELFIELW